ncbi:MAG: LysR family transcriptional regulator [Burkholderiales bacterium]|nr:LysR family transcriptional regulator [Burkholderiales bacterium]
MFDNIALFTELVERKSFTDTARHNNISQSTLSKRISQLEQNFGTTLIVHSTRNFEITKDGYLVYNQFKSLRKQLKQSIDLIKNEEDLDKTLRANISTSFAYEVICPYLHEFTKSHPKISLDVFFQHSYEEDPLDGFDIAITNFPIDNEDYANYLIFKEPAQLFCSPQYVEKYGLPKAINELENHRFIGIISNTPVIHSPPYITFTHRYSKEEIIFNNLSNRLKTNLPSHMKQIGMHGDYIFGSWKRLCDKEIQTGKIITVLPDYEVYTSEFFITVRKEHSTAEDKFVDFIYRCVNRFTA